MTQQELITVKEHLSGVNITNQPSSWYYGGRLKGERIQSLDLYGNKLMVVLQSNGNYRVFSRSCLHMGVDLTFGKMSKNGTLMCPMHAWSYKSDGTCASPTLQKGKCLKEFPAYNYKGHLFVFIGDQSRFFPFPTFEESDRLAIVTEPIRFRIEIPWYLATANGFDVNHFIMVHKRKLYRKPTIIINSTSTITAQLEFTNVGNEWRDRLLRQLFGDVITMNYEVAAGNITLAISTFKKTRNYMMFVLHPVNDRQTDVFLFPMKTNGKSALLNSIGNAISFPIRKILIKDFFGKEIRSIREVVFNPDNMTIEDEVFLRYMKWLVDNIN